MNRVRIANGAPVELKVGGFANQQVSHGHFFKHVARLAGLEPEELERKRDPEAWHELIVEPKLEPDLANRRAKLLSKLEAAGGCALACEAPTSRSVCAKCDDERAVSRVGNLVGDFLSQYRKVAEGVFEFAVDNPARKHLRLVAYRQGASTRVKAIDDRRCTAVGVLESTGKIAVLSCYREVVGRSFAARWLEICRERAGHERAGTLVAVERAEKQEASHVEA